LDDGKVRNKLSVSALSSSRKQKVRIIHLISKSAQYLKLVRELLTYHERTGHERGIQVSTRIHSNTLSSQHIHHHQASWKSHIRRRNTMRFCVRAQVIDYYQYPISRVPFSEYNIVYVGYVGANNLCVLN
jgi:hypothetical protein